MSHSFINLLSTPSSIANKILLLQQEVARQKRIGNTAREEQIALALLEKLNKINVDHTSVLNQLRQLSQYDMSFHEELETLTYLTSVWADFFNDVFSYENNPLGLSALLLNRSIDSECEFAGFILYCFRNNHPILNAGFLHQFVQINIINLDSIENTYTLLRAQNQEGEPLQNWINRLGTIDAELNRFQMSLIGEQKNSLTKLERQSISMSINPSAENWQKLYDFFESAFLPFALEYYNSLHDEPVKNTLKDLLIAHINSCNIDLSGQSLEQKSEMYHAIFSLVSQITAEKLLLNQGHSIWLTLPQYPHPITPSLKTLCINKMSLTSPHTIQERKYAVECAGRLSESAFIFEILFNTIYDNNLSILEEDHEVSRFLIHSSMRFNALIVEKNQALIQNMIDLSRSDDYSLLYGEFLAKKNNVLLLSKLGANNPLDGTKYDFTTWYINQKVLDTMNDEEKLASLERCLSLIVCDEEHQDFLRLRAQVSIEYLLSVNVNHAYINVVVRMLNETFNNWITLLQPAKFVVLANKSYLLDLVYFELNTPEDTKQLAITMGQYGKHLDLLYAANGGSNGCKVPLNEFLQYCSIQEGHIQTMRSLDHAPPEHRHRHIRSSIYASDDSIFYCGTTSFDLMFKDLIPILKLLPIEIRRITLNTKNRNGNTLLQKAYISGDIRILKTIFKLLSAQDRYTIMLDEYSTNVSLLTQAAIDANTYPEYLDLFIKLLPVHERLIAINHKSNFGYTLLQNMYYYPNVLKKIIELLDINDRIKAICEFDINGLTLLNYSLDSNSTLKMIFEHIPKEERLGIIRTYNVNYSFLNNYTNHPELILTILHLLPKHHCPHLLQDKLSHGGTWLHTESILKSCSSFKSILNSLHKNDRLTIIHEKNASNLSVLHCATQYPKSLEAIFELLPLDERFPAAKDVLLTHRDSWISFEPIRTIFKFFTSSVRWSLIQDENTHRVIFLENLNRSNPDLIEPLLELLHENDRLIARQAISTIQKNLTPPNRFSFYYYNDMHFDPLVDDSRPTFGSTTGDWGKLAKIRP